MKKFEKVEKTGIISTKFSLPCTPSVILGWSCMRFAVHIGMKSFLKDNFLLKIDPDFRVNKYSPLIFRQKAPKNQKCYNLDTSVLFNLYFKGYKLITYYLFKKDQLNSEWIYDVIVSPKMQTKNYKNFCLTKQTRIVAKTAYTHQKITKKKYYDPCLYDRAEILVIFGLHFGRNDDLINSFWI